MPTLEQLKEAYGENYSEVDVTDANPTPLQTEESKEGDLSLIAKKAPRTQRKVKFAKK